MASLLPADMKTPQKWLVTIILSLILAGPYAAWLVAVNPPLVERWYLIFPVILALGSVVSFLFVHHVFIPNRSKYPTRVWLLGLFAFIAIGIWYVFIISATILPPPFGTARLEIVATGQRHPEAKGSEVWVQALYATPDETVKTEDFQFDASWEVRGNALLSNQYQPARLRWSGKTDRDVTLVLTSHPWSGIVEIIWNGQKQTVDLYDPVSKTKEITLPLDAAAGKRLLRWQIVLWQISTGASIGFILSMVSAFLATRKGFVIQTQKTGVIPQVLFPLVIFSLYLATASWLLPAGVSKDFFTKIARYVAPITTTLSVAVLIDTVLKIEKPKKGRLFALDFLLLLFPLTPVVQYILNNGEILSFAESILLFSIFAALVSIPIIVIPLLLRKVTAFRHLMALGLAFSFSVTNMASLSKQFSWHEAGATWTQLAVFGLVWAAFMLLFHFKMRSFAYIAVVIYFATNSIFQLPARSETRSSPETDFGKNQLVQAIGDRKPAETPGIYLLVYDAYVPNETMTAYGIDNRPQEQYLEEKGFTLYPKTYSVGPSSLSSMSRVLNASTDYYGDSRRAVSGDGVVQNLLRDYGYKTYGLFPWDYFYLGVTPTYDVSFPGPANPVKFLSDGIFTGEFKFDIGFKDTTREKLSSVKQRVLSETSTGPRFLYTHQSLPSHSQNSGVCLPDETELFKERLARANLEMKKDVELVLENDPGAIIIVAGDHGPYLTKNCLYTVEDYPISEITRLDIQDRFGSFLAIRWPSSNFEDYDEITVLQDVFPAVFAYLFEDPELLKSKIKPEILENNVISGASVSGGIIQGGVNDGEPLYTGQSGR